MNEDVLNLSLRKFLKKVGVTSQREIEQAIRTAVQNSKLSGNETVKATVTLKIADVDLNVTIDGAIELS